MSEVETNDSAKQLPRLGSYRLLRPLGSGGMSSVFHAVHIESGHEVAVKVLPRALAKNPTLLQRFMREAKNAEALEHESIASIFDRGFDQGRHYLVLEYVEGGDLNDRVKNSGPLALDAALKAIKAVAEGLLYALGRGVIHRDIKPANLLLTDAGRIKIIDLGLALQTESDDERVTRDGTTVGTVDYMSPEQARDSRATSERSDIYSLGCTLYFLLTGKPPFPGGDIVNKLGRHCLAPIPDVRELRPDASEPLAFLIQVMMAKKPEKRFATYNALILAIENLPELGGPSKQEALDALILEEEPGLVPEPTSFGGRSPGSGSSWLPSPASNSGMRAGSNADIARAESSPSDPSRSGYRPQPTKSETVPSPEAALDLESHYFEADEPVFVERGSPRAIPLTTWIAAGAVLGLAVALVGFGVVKVLNPSRIPLASQGHRTPVEGNVARQDDLPNEDARPIRPVPEGLASIPKKKGEKSLPSALLITEPPDPTNEVKAEQVYPPDIEAAALPEWTKLPIPDRVEGPFVSLRRVVDPTDETYVSTMRIALDKNGGVVEVADNGPFFEDDCRIAGKATIIRASVGHRPMLRIKVDKNSLRIVNDRPAVFILDGTSLTLDGLDVIVDVRDLPPATISLFLLKGAELTLHNCSVTILNGSIRPFAMIRLDDPLDDRVKRGSQVRIERSLIRDSSGTTINLNGPADLAFIRSLILCGGESLIGQGTSTSRGDRRLYFSRSVIATRGSVVEVPGVRTIPAQVRALGSTFAKVSGVNESGFIRARDVPTANLPAIVDWRAYDSQFVGWPSWFSAGAAHKLVLSGLASVRETWPGASDRCREANRRWPASVLADDATAETLKDVSDEPAAIASLVAVPSKSLLNSTVRSFTPQPTPAIPPRRQLLDSRGVTSTTAADPNVVELTFEVQDPVWRGDLGRFLAKMIVAGSPKTRVRVVGGGEAKLTPIRLPNGVSVEIESAAPPGEEPTWTAIPGASHTALIELTGGDLSLKGIHLDWSASALLNDLIRVENGHLLLSGCILRTRDGMMPANASLVRFRATGTRPLTRASGFFLSETDRPVLHVIDSTLIATGGFAIQAELGRGIVNLRNSVVIHEAEGAAVRLHPEKVAKARFEADLTLEHCSIAAERNLILIDPWPGSSPGPDRPWLVSSQKSVFIEIPQRGRRESVLLRTHGAALAHGSLFWQADRDAYDLPHFTFPGNGAPAPNRQRPDVKSQWTDFWGSNHVMSVVGPNSRRTEAVITLASHDRLRPGGVSAESLRLDPRVHTDLGVDLRYFPKQSPRPSAFFGVVR